MLFSGGSAHVQTCFASARRSRDRWSHPPLHAVGQTVTPHAFATETVQGRTVVADRVLVKFKAVPSAAILASARSEGSADYLEPIGGAGWYLLKSKSVTSAQLIAALSTDPAVDKVEPDYVGRPMAAVPSRLIRQPAAALRPMFFDMPSDTFFSSQWAFDNTGQCFGSTCGTSGDDINATAGWTIAHGSSSVVIADFDTGIDYNNPDLAANVWAAPSAYTITEGGNIYDCPQGSHGINVVDNQSGCAGQEIDAEGHGTITSGVADAVTDNSLGVAGTAWNVPIISIKMCGPSCDSATTITAIDAALQIGSHFGLRIVAGNMSHGDLGGSALEDEMALAGRSGMMFAASTGNECNSGADDPASFHLGNELAVAASDQLNDRAYWGGGQCSNGGGDIAAPGTNVYTTVLGDDGTHPALEAGTSVSAPFVTGAIALLESACALTPSVVKATLEGTADDVPALTSVATDGRLLNLGTALASCTTGVPASAQVEVGGNGCSSCYTPPYPPGPRPLPARGEATVTIDGHDYSAGYNAKTSTSLTIANALAGSINGTPYYSAQVSGSANSATITITATADGPYTNGYAFSTSMTDTCTDNPPHTECDDNPFGLDGGGNFTGGHN